MQIELSVFYARLGSIALIMTLGFLLGKFKIISEHTNKQITNLLLTVFMPASLFMAFPSEYNQDSANLFFSGLLAGTLIMFVLIILAKLIFNKKWMKKELSDEAQFAMIFNNATFLGYPIVANTFGASGILAYCGFIIAFNIALFSYGIWLFEQKISIKLLLNIIFNPNIIAVILGMILFLIGIKLPSFLTDAVGYIGGATTPLSIICIGFMLSQAKLKNVFKKWRLMLTALIQLTLGPLVTWGILTLLQFPIEVIEVCTLIQALPTATSLGLFAVKYGGNAAESSELVTISTIFSVATLPLMVLLLLV
ncbi:AEC family transporter [Candidatus Saccharibacteria bacterium]|nr:AEC family transporter [Candidatus Saccharibacteria bacterium]MBQ1540125.1 AEC family transporter [Candidatus Saccharibacteria bacterium]